MYSNQNNHTSTINNKKILNVDSSNYHFIVSGHFHGASSNVSGFPASSLLANIDTLNKINPLFLVSLGDLFLDASKENIENYRRSFFKKINFPLFNAVGNHDTSDEYKKQFGPTFSSFSIKSEAFIFLDTEKNDGSIKNEQYDFLKNVLQSASQNISIKNVFIFSHRPVWAENSPQFKGLFKGNTRTEVGMNNFESEVKPLLFTASKVKNIYWMSGSLGGGPASFFYAKDDHFNITYLQTAIRDLSRDAALKVNIENGTVKFTGISFSGKELRPIEKYNIEFWKKDTPAEEKFNWRLLPYLIKQMILHYYFWIGLILSAIILVSIYFIQKRKSV